MSLLPHLHSLHAGMTHTPQKSTAGSPRPRPPAQVIEVMVLLGTGSGQESYPPPGMPPPDYPGGPPLMPPMSPPNPPDAPIFPPWPPGGAPPLFPPSPPSPPEAWALSPGPGFVFTVQQVRSSETAHSAAVGRSGS